MGFVKFMSSPTGRLVRALLGVAIIAFAVFTLEGAAQIIVAIIGVLPVAAGTLDFCIASPLLGAPFKGSDIRNTN